MAAATVSSHEKQPLTGADCLGDPGTGLVIRKQGRVSVQLLFWMLCEMFRTGM